MQSMDQDKTPQLLAWGILITLVAGIGFAGYGVVALWNRPQFSGIAPAPIVEIPEPPPPIAAVQPAATPEQGPDVPGGAPPQPKENEPREREQEPAERKTVSVDSIPIPGVERLPSEKEMPEATQVTWKLGDLASPVIALYPDARGHTGAVYLQRDDKAKYEEPGYIALDGIDGDITAKVSTENNVNASRIGSYSVKYSVADAAGNTAVAERIVEVVTAIPPDLRMDSISVHFVEQASLDGLETVSDTGVILIGGEPWTESAKWATWRAMPEGCINPCLGDLTNPAPGCDRCTANQVNLLAVPDPGYEFMGWNSELGTIVGPLLLNVPVLSGERVYASFGKINQVTIDQDLNLCRDLAEVIHSARMADPLSKFDAGWGSPMGFDGDQSLYDGFGSNDGVPDAAELMLFEAVLRDRNLTSGGIRHKILHMRQAWSNNLEAAKALFVNRPSSAAHILAAYVTMGGKSGVRVAEALFQDYPEMNDFDYRAFDWTNKVFEYVANQIDEDQIDLAGEYQRAVDNKIGENLGAIFNEFVRLALYETHREELSEEQQEKMRLAMEEYKAQKQAKAAQSTPTALKSPRGKTDFSKPSVKGLVKLPAGQERSEPEQVPWKLQDTGPPILVLYPDERGHTSVVYAKRTQGEIYKSPGYLALDGIDGDITEKVRVEPEIKLDELGLYTLHYTVKDAAGNTATQERAVNVVEMIPETTEFCKVKEVIFEVISIDGVESPAPPAPGVLLFGGRSRGPESQWPRWWALNEACIPDCQYSSLTSEACGECVGNTLSLQAIPNPGYEFDTWMLFGAPMKIPSLGQVDLSSDSLSIQAKYKKIEGADIEPTLNLAQDLAIVMHELNLEGSVTTFDTAWASMGMGDPNGVPDVAELMLLEAVLKDALLYNTPLSGGTPGNFRSAWRTNLQSARALLNGRSSSAINIYAAYRTMGGAWFVKSLFDAYPEVQSSSWGRPENWDLERLAWTVDDDRDSLLEEYETAKQQNPNADAGQLFNEFVRLVIYQEEPSKYSSRQ